MSGSSAAAGPSKMVTFSKGVRIQQSSLPRRMPASMVVGVAVSSVRQHSSLSAHSFLRHRASAQILLVVIQHRSRRHVSTEPVRPDPPPPPPPSSSSRPSYPSSSSREAPNHPHGPFRSQLAKSSPPSASSSSAESARSVSGTSEKKSEVPSTTGGEKEESKEVAKKDKNADKSLPARAWAVVKKEAAHYWAGTKLLGKEIRISTKLLYQVLKGDTLTRRERRQLRRTTSDLLRLIPFSVFVVVPFMEFLLPVALRLFPNMLPSTFEGKFAREEKERKLLRVRIEMAKFLQETVKESGLKADSVVRSDEFKDFFRKVRSTGETPSHDDVVRVAKLFHDDITLDNLTRPQLVSVCRYMNINAWGTDNLLKMHIRNKLEKVRVDDMMIFAEGVDSLSTKELQQASQSRGIRITGVSPARLREELEQWIDFHYNHGISGVLLILSRAFNFNGDKDDLMSDLVTTLGSLPENLIDEAELNVADESSYKQKLDVLQQQQELIEDEEEQELEEEEARKEKREAEEAAKQEAEAAKQGSEPTDPAEPAAAPTGAQPAMAEAALPEAVDARMTSEQLNELAEALSILTAKSSIAKERDELHELLEDNLLSEAEADQRGDEDKGAVAVSKRVRSMITKIDNQLEKYDEKVGSSLNVIQTNAKGQITLGDLKRAMQMIKHKPSDEEIEELGKKLDVDSDGLVELDHVVELTQDRRLGLEMEDEEAKKLVSRGQDIRHSKDVKDLKPKREDIISDE